MINTLKNLSILTLTFSMLMGCHEALNYAYLMQHPNVLKRELNECEKNSSLTEEKNEHCRIVMFAAENMLSILKQQEENPEKFGERLLRLEASRVKTRLALQDAQKILKALEKEKASQDLIKKAKEKSDRLSKVYAGQTEEINVMLAVIGIHTPN